jgi:signal transduction histidine kinase
MSSNTYKNIVKKYKNLLLFAFFLILGIAINISDNLIKQDRINTSVFSNILLLKEHKVDNITDSILLNVNNNNLKNWIYKNSKNLEYLSINDGISFFIYTNDSLTYWSNNNIAIPDNNKWFNKPFAKTGNSFLEIQKKQNDSITIIGSILIKDNFPYENRFISNNFHKSFNLDNTFNLEINKNNPNAIYNKDGIYLFSLTKTGTDNLLLKNRILVVLFLTSILFLLIFIFGLFKNKKISIRRFAIVSTLLITARILIYVFNFPHFLTELPIFQSEFFSYTPIFPSLGDLLITVTLVTYLIFTFYTKVKIDSFKTYSKNKIYLIFILYISVIIIYSSIAQQIFLHLIINSSFEYEAYNVLSLTVFSFVGYFILLLLFIGIIFLIDKISIQLKNIISLKEILIILLSFEFVIILTNILAKQYNSIFPVVFIFFIIIFWIRIRLLSTPNFNTIVILTALFSAYATYYIRIENSKKRIDDSKKLAINIANEKDPVAEIIIEDIINQIKSDSVINSYINKKWFDFNGTANYIQQEYFTGYLNKYIFNLTVCNNTDSIIIDEKENTKRCCYTFFDKLLKTDGQTTKIKGLYKIKNLSGGLNYFIKIKIPKNNPINTTTLFLELTTRPNFEPLGYPELLLKKVIDKRNTFHYINYARYNNNKLIINNGDFAYALECDIYGYNNTKFSFFQLEGYDHLLYNAPNNQTVIVSFPTIKLHNILTSFTYIFFFLIIQTTILLIIGNGFLHLITFNFNIKNKIVISMLLTLFLSLIFVSVGAVFYTKSEFKKEQIEILNEKTQSVLVELEHELSEFNNINEIDPNYINKLLIKFSNIFFSDINLYSPDGKLIGTSRKEIFERNLLSKNINPTAYRELIFNKKAEIINNESIGNMEYYSAYIPFFNSNNEILAYINLPYFSKELILQRKLLHVVITVINIFAFILILSVIIVIYVSNKITEPLILVQKRISSIDLSNKNEYINYKGRDEVAKLVVEYNRMLKALDKSARLLAKSERESAWREMARQIAHEIKNPLTPMKLSIQLLDKSWKNDDDDFGKRFENSTKTLIEQINSLSSIADAFSQFARMPATSLEKFDIIERIKRSTLFFEEFSRVKLKINIPDKKELFIYADKDKILRVFNNILKNAMQSIPENRKGEITINLAESHESVVIEIKDNGSGIPQNMEDKLYEPNFTTKTSGTGLGLAIVKNIIEEFGGAIWHESKLNEGTSFFISLPIYK